MTIYLDVVFIENILMNYIILFGVAKIQKIKTSNLRLITASGVGALYAIFNYLKIVPAFSNSMMKILLSAIIVYIAFNSQNVKKMLKSLVLFYLTSFATGGCAIALMYMVSPDRVSFRNGVFVGTYPLKITLIAGGVGFAIIQYSFAINKRRLNHSDLLCKLTVKLNGEIIETTAFIDSGNNLKEPITGKPVIILEKRLISKSIGFENVETKGGDEPPHIFVIPFKAIGKSNGVMIGVKAEYAQIEYEEEKFLIKNAIIGLCEKRIGKYYSALVGLDIANNAPKAEKGMVIK